MRRIPEVCMRSAFGVRRSAFGVQGSGFRFKVRVQRSGFYRFSFLGYAFQTFVFSWFATRNDNQEPCRTRNGTGNFETEHSEPEPRTRTENREPRTENPEPRTRHPRTRTSNAERRTPNAERRTPNTDVICASSDA